MLIFLARKIINDHIFTKKNTRKIIDDHIFSTKNKKCTHFFISYVGVPSVAGGGL